jgi:hypothetical protein
MNNRFAYLMAAGLALAARSARRDVRRQALGLRTNNESDEPQQESVNPCPSLRNYPSRTTVRPL